MKKMKSFYSIIGYTYFSIRKIKKWHKENIEKFEKFEIIDEKLKIKRKRKKKKKKKKDDNNNNNDDDDCDDDNGRKFFKNDNFKISLLLKMSNNKNNNKNNKNRKNKKESNEGEEKNFITIDRLNDDMKSSAYLIDGSDDEKKIILGDVTLMNNKESINEKDKFSEELETRHIKSNKVNTGCVVEEAKDLESWQKQTSVSKDKNNLLIEDDEMIINSDQKHVSDSKDNNKNDRELTPPTYPKCKYEEMIKNDKTLSIPCFLRTGDEVIIDFDQKYVSDSQDSKGYTQTYSTRSIVMIKNDKTPTSNELIINSGQKHVSDSQDNNKSYTPQTYSKCKYEEMIKNDKSSLTKSINSNEEKIRVKFEEVIDNKIPRTYSIQANKKVAKYEEMTKVKIKKQISLTETDNDHVTPRFLGGCKRCHREQEAEDWCKYCEIEKFKQNFKNWTSGNSKVDEIIQNSQLNATDCYNYFEWINNEEIKNVEYVVNGGFGKIFKGTWITGPKKRFHTVRNIWENVPTVVALKELEFDDFNLKTSFDQFLNELQSHRKFLPNRFNHVLRCFGVTKSPDDYTKWNVKSEKRPKPNSYMMVMVWANDGDLFSYIRKHSRDKNFTWYKRLGILEELSGALESIHSENMIHQDLHCGNILIDDKNILQFPAISDFGLCGNYNETGVLKGVVAFTAPEHLKEQPEKFTKASDIYSFGIIMWVIGCCKLPYEEFKDDPFLQYFIVNGRRPTIPKYIPQEYAKLVESCWDGDPKKRPEALELKNTFIKWKKQYESNEFFNAEKERLRRIQNPDIVIDAFESQGMEMERSKQIQPTIKLTTQPTIKSTNNFLSVSFEGACLKTKDFENQYDNTNLIYIK